jgi:hypothetical protein
MGGMSTDAKKSIAVIATALACLLAVSVYGTAYLLLGDCGDFIFIISHDGGPENVERVRQFKSVRLAWVFEPAAAVESFLTGTKVSTSVALTLPSFLGTDQGREALP